MSKVLFFLLMTTFLAQTPCGYRTLQNSTFHIYMDLSFLSINNIVSGEPTHLQWQATRHLFLGSEGPMKFIFLYFLFPIFQDFQLIKKLESKVQNSMIERTTNIPTLYPLKDLSPSISFYLYKTQAALREQQNVL